MVWESLKAYLRGLLIATINKIKTAYRREELTFLTVEMAEREVIDDPSTLISRVCIN